jgi:hypothetical protein
VKNSLETEQDLQRLIGQFESVRLEFKASALLAHDSDRIVKQLTENVSAFANTEGGVIVIGIREGKSGQKSVATEIDEGVDPNEMPPDRLEQLIASNISPSIPGLTVRPILLSGEKAGRVIYIVNVPRGTTAYQARHTLRYYGRTEFAATPLHDNVIRLLMSRGRVPQASLELVKGNTFTAEQVWSARQAELRDIQERREAGELLMHGRGIPEREYFDAPKLTYDQYEFYFGIVNTSEITIRDFMLGLTFISDFTVHYKWSQEQFAHDVQCGIETKFRFEQDKVTKRGNSGERLKSPKDKLFPGDRVHFPECSWFIRVPAGTNPESFAELRWKIYLDDAPPNSGEFKINDFPAPAVPLPRPRVFQRRQL